MSILRLALPALLALSGMAWISNSTYSKVLPAINVDSVQGKNARLDLKANEARQFVKNKGFNDQFIFLIDMSISSANNRFFIYDLKNDSLVRSALVSHGVCYGGETDSKFSNIVGSGCSSLGKYKIGIPYVGQWGYSYKLHGLESTNSNAYERTVVLHSHQSIPDIETGDEIAVSLGCPMVSPNFLLTLKKVINNSKKPVLLWIYQ